MFFNEAVFTVHFLLTIDPLSMSPLTEKTMLTALTVHTAGC